MYPICFGDLVESDGLFVELHVPLLDISNFIEFLFLLVRKTKNQWIILSFLKLALQFDFFLN